MACRALVLLAALSTAFATPAASEAPAGAASCSGCHSPTIDGPIPSLAGRSAEDIVADMRAFRTGARESTVMDRIAKGFSDEETRAIAEWLAAGGDVEGSTEP